MFSSVFEKVVSTTAPGALAMFPQRAALPVSASTLCCLSFADWFLKDYPILSIQEIDEDCNFTNLRLVGRAGVSGVAVSADELDSVMQNAAKLGCRLAPALAGTSWSRSNESRTVSVSELLTKIRGIFGNRLTCVDRDIRVMRDAQAEKDENLLLRQIYTLKNAALETCNGQKWCIVVSSGGESLIVCSVPLPPTEVDRKYGCDFLVFDPWPRPTMKLQGSYIVKFTTVRGLQLHLLSVLGEIWRERDRADQGTIKDEFVLLSVVIDTERPEQENFNTKARGLLRESVTRLRKAEKAAAIKIKREEVNALRRALEKSKQENAIGHEPVAGRVVEWKDDRCEKRGGARSDLLSGSASSYSIGRSECLHLTPERNSGEEGFAKCEEATPEQVTKASEAGIAISTTEPARMIKASSSGHIEVDDVQGGGNHLRTSGDRYDLTDPPQQRPPFAGSSPPLTARKMTIEKRWTGENWEENGEHGRDLRPATEPKTAQGSRSETLGAKGSHVERVGGAETFESPLNRALLRSLEGEALEDYSKRAYKVCRTNGIIHFGVLGLDPIPAPWRASPPVLSCSFGSANSFPVVSAPATSTIRGIDRRLGLGNLERESQDIEEAPFPAVQHDYVDRKGIQHRGTFPANGGLDEATLVDSAAGNCSVPVVDDVSASEETVPHPVLTASRPPSEKTRSRLEAPRAGRALASASSNAREGSTHSTKELNGPQLDLSRNPLPPPPHVPKLSVCARKMWNDDGPLRSTSGDRRASCTGKQEGKRFGEVIGNSDLVAGKNVTDDRVALLSPRGSCSRHSTTPERTERSRFDDAQRSLVGEMGKRGDELLTVGPSRQQENAENNQGFGDGSSPVDSKKGKGRSIGGRTDHDRGIAERGDHKRKIEKVTERLADCPRPINPPRVIHRKRDFQFDGPQMTMKSRMPTPVALSDDIEHMPPTVPDIKSTGPEAESTPMGVNDAFVWFGEPDSPACHRSTESVEVAADARGTGTTRRGQTCILQHQRNKAKLLLEMDVRRQRNIIECALRARERSRRMRRFKLGAEVLMKFYALRRDAESKKLSQEHKPFSNADQQGDEQANGKTVPEMAALQNNRRRAIGAKSPEFVAESVEPAPMGVGTKAVPGIKDTAEWTEARRPGDEPEPHTGDPFIRLESREDHGGIPATRASAPLPVSFEVMADGIAGLGAGRGGKHEQARRQKRLEALRARKAAEAKERQRIQKERRAAAKKEEHQKATTDIPAEKYTKYLNEQTNRQAFCNDRGTTDRHGTSSNHSHARSPSLSEEVISSRVRNTNGSPTVCVPQEAGEVKSDGAWCEAKVAPVKLAKDGSPVVRGLSRRSNRQLVRNAINFLCLAGDHVQDKKGRVLQALDSHRGLNFILLLSHNNLLTFKGLYACSGEGGEIAERLCGVGPPQINVGMVSGFYKYNSAAREFCEVHSKTLGKTTDAVSVEPTKFRRPNGQCNL